MISVCNREVPGDNHSFFAFAVGETLRVNACFLRCGKHFAPGLIAVYCNGVSG